MTKEYMVWWTYGFSNMKLPTPIEAYNKEEAIRKFIDKGENFNEIIQVNEVVEREGEDDD